MFPYGLRSSLAFLSRQERRSIAVGRGGLAHSAVIFDVNRALGLNDLKAPGCERAHWPTLGPFRRPRRSASQAEARLQNGRPPVATMAMAATRMAREIRKCANLRIRKQRSPKVLLGARRGGRMMQLD